MTSTDNKKQQDIKNGCIGCLGIFVILVLGMSACSVLFAPKKQTAQEKADEWYKELSPYACIEELKGQLRDPDSYKANSDGAVLGDTGTEKMITWQFRAKNGFGGYNNGVAVCKVEKENSKVSVSFENL